MKKSRMVIQFDLFGTLIINPGNCILTVFHLYCCTKHKVHCLQYAFGLLTLRSFLCASSSCIHVWIQVIKKWKYNRCDKENGNQSHQSNASTISLFFKYMCWIIKVWLFFNVVQYLNECCKASVSNNLFISSTFCQLCRTTNKGNKMKRTPTQTIFP